MQPVWQGGCDALPPGDYRAEPGDLFIRNQFIVTGNRDQVREVMDDLAASSRSLRIKAVDEIDLRSLSQRLVSRLSNRSDDRAAREEEIRPRYPLEQAADVVVRAYQLSEGVTLEEAFDAFYGAVGDHAVYAEPNYLIGNPDIAGNSGCVEGGPAVPTGAGSGQAAFWDQWAFSPQGIDLYAQSSKLAGQGTRVAVFDTSPFCKPGLWHIPWIKTDLDICVAHPRPLVDLQSKVEEKEDYRDHGLFVSSLVHAVAQKAKIQLIRVLDKHNQGDLETLVKALYDYTLGSESRGRPLERTVINLSLGLVDEPGTQRDWLLELKERLLARDALLQYVGRGYEQTEVPVVYLETVLGMAREAGATIVAASGNKSSQAEAEPMLVPAAYKFVIGVAGHNIDRERSSFSNQGNIAAPGGDGPPDFEPNDRAGNAIPDHWLVGLSMRSEPVEGYMYWMGTSFAAPLVAGHAARLLGVGHWKRPHQVRPIIEGSIEAAVNDPNSDMGVGCATVP
jgi:hypothetical protein